MVGWATQVLLQTSKEKCKTTSPQKISYENSALENKLCGLFVMKGAPDTALLVTTMHPSAMMQFSHEQKVYTTHSSSTYA